MRELRRRAAETARDGLADDEEGVDAPIDLSAEALGGSDRARRIRDAVESALSDILLLGTEEQVRLAGDAIAELVAGRRVHTPALVVSLRDFIRASLDLAPIPASIADNLPAQGLTRPSGGGGGSSRGRDGTGRRPRPRRRRNRWRRYERGNDCRRRFGCRCGEGRGLVSSMAVIGGRMIARKVLRPCAITRRPSAMAATSCMRKSCWKSRRGARRRRGNMAMQHSLGGVDPGSLNWGKSKS